MNAKNILPAFFIIFGFLLAACSMPGPATEAPMAPTLPAEGDTPQPATAVPLRPPKVATSTPTLAPSGPEEFSTDNLNEVPPDGILEEIAILGVGGGGSICSLPYAGPSIASDPEDTELMMDAEMVTCGWTEGDELSFTVTFPNGHQIYEKKIVDGSGQGTFSYRPALDDPEGLYRFEIIGRKLKLESNVYFRAPVVPRFYILDDGHLVFDKFQPYEKIRLFLYFDLSGVYVFQGWQEFAMDANGRLFLDAPVAEGYFFAQTESGLEIPLTTSNLGKMVFRLSREADLSADSQAKRQALEAKSQAHLACPAGFVSRIDPNAGPVHPIRQTWLYANPRTTARQVLHLEPGQALTLRSASITPMICVDGRGWRWVTAYANTGANNTSLSYSGYVIEIDENKNHQIEPGIALDPTPTPPPSCPGSLTSRLAVDARARVAFTDGSNMRIRAKPGFTQDTLRTVPEGTLLTITGGPMCVDNTSWWRIRTRDGFDGWMAEYKGDVYLVEPFQW